MEITRKLKMGVLGAGVAALVAVPTAFAVGGGSDSPATRPQASDEDRSPPIVAALNDEEDEFDEGFDEEGSEFELAEEVAFLNGLADEIAGALTAAGVDHTVETLEVRSVTWDTSDEAANAIVEALLEEYFEYDEDDALDEFEDLDAEELALYQGEADAVRVALEAAGIPFEIELDELGIGWPVFDEEDDAIWDVVDEALDAYWEPIEAEELANLSVEELDELRQEAAVVRDALLAAGIAFEVEVDAAGVEWPIFDEDDDEAWEVVEGALDAFWGEFDEEDHEE
ncbi:MAG: hypothetical protein DK306_001844 [Chloroflexi bacterium]|nr:MAG: hypothetical protein DK306_001844 [Chloroflexota bacterium]